MIATIVRERRAVGVVITRAAPGPHEVDDPAARRAWRVREPDVSAEAGHDARACATGA